MATKLNCNTVFSCVVCNKSLHRFAWKTYMQTKAYSYEFKCRYCRTRYEHNQLIALPLLFLYLFCLVKASASGFIDDSNPLLLVPFFAGWYFVWAISPVKNKNIRGR